jgi:hypothetical protein
MSIFSSSEELILIKETLSKYLRLPFSGETIPGAVMEAVLSYIRKAKRLNTYDFVDVIDIESRCGWQVKSTKSQTPVTWKRAKIPNSLELIEESRSGVAGLQKLGDAIIAFCNAHAQESIDLYDLNEIGYSRLILFDDGRVCYFERLLCTRDNPNVFNKDDFIWRWSIPKKTVKKEQLQALHGINKHTQKKWWAWHGLGENQLHFSGENEWWPKSDAHTATFQFPGESEKISLERLFDILLKSDEMPS